MESRDQALFDRYIQINHMIDTYDHILNGEITEKELGLTNKQFLCVVQGVLRPRFEELQKEVIPRYKELSLDSKMDISTSCSDQCSCTIFNTIEPLPGIPGPQDRPEKCIEGSKNAWKNVSNEIKAEIKEYCLTNS